MFSRELLRELSKRDLEIRFRHIIPEERSEVASTDWYREMLKPASRPDLPLLIFHTPAGTTGAGFFREVRAMNPGHSRYIGMTMFESDRIHPSWVDSIEAVDELWVPTDFNRQTFSRCGVPRAKIQVMPLGVDENRFNLNDKTRIVPNSGRSFNFLSVFEWTWRKGWDVLLYSYVSAFTREEDVSLTLCVYRGGGATSPDKRTINQRIDDFLKTELGTDRASAPMIHVVEERIPDDQWAAFYRGHDALLLPTRGEGWGLPCNEAMALGIPVAATGWGATQLFSGKTTAFYIEPDKLVPAALEQVLDNGLFAGHLMARPLPDSLVRCMREIFTKRDEAKKIAMKGAEYVREEFTIQKAADRIEKRLREIHRETPVESIVVPSNPNAAPYRYLWVGDESGIDGLPILLACYQTAFRNQEPVTLTLAGSTQATVAALRNIVQSFLQPGSAQIKVLEQPFDPAQRYKLIADYDVFVSGHARDAGNPFCLEAMQVGLPVIANFQELPEFLRSESTSFSMPTRNFVKVAKGDRSLWHRSYPNILCPIFTWTFENREATAQRGANAQKNLQQFIDQETSETIKVYSKLKPTELTSDSFEWIPLSAPIHDSVFPGLFQSRLMTSSAEFIAFACGQPKLDLDRFKKFAEDSFATVLYEEQSSKDGYLVLRSAPARTYSKFDLNFDGLGCFREYVREAKAQGAKAMEYLFESSSQWTPEMQAVSSFTRALEAFNAKKLTAACEWIEKTLSEKKDYPEALYLSAQFISDPTVQADPDEIERAYLQLIYVKPMHAAGRHALGAFYYSQGKLDQAEDHIRFATRLENETSTYWSDLGVVLVAKGEMEDAMTALIRAVSTDTGNLDALKNIIDLCVKLEKFQDARRWLKVARSYHPTDPEILSCDEALKLAETKA